MQKHRHCVYGITDKRESPTPQKSITLIKQHVPSGLLVWYYLEEN